MVEVLDPLEKARRALHGKGLGTLIRGVFPLNQRYIELAEALLVVSAW